MAVNQIGSTNPNPINMYRSEGASAPENAEKLQTTPKASNPGYEVTISKEAQKLSAGEDVRNKPQVSEPAPPPPPAPPEKTEMETREYSEPTPPPPPPTKAEMENRGYGEKY